jgi:hypothetical protein
MDNLMSVDLSSKLNGFSLVANKDILHYLDTERFVDFTIQAHLEKSSLDKSTLGEILADQGWSEAKALELSNKYDFGRDILARLNK